MLRTEYSTFTYYLTHLIKGKTVTKTDIIVSSSVVKQAGGVEITPTPTLEPSPTTATADNLETRTYFTTSTYYSTFIDKSRTLTRSVLKFNLRIYVKRSVNFFAGDEAFLLYFNFLYDIFT